MSITINVDDIVDLLDVPETNTVADYGNEDIEELIKTQYKTLAAVNAAATEVEFVYMGFSFTVSVHSEQELISAWHRVLESVTLI